MDIRLLDHLIITEYEFFSFADEGKLEWIINEFAMKRVSLREGCMIVRSYLT
jgi:hypothetical protein